MEPGDVFSDLSEELVKIVLRYYGKSENEMKPLLITSLRNRCTDLQMMEYATHRDIGESDLGSLDEEIDMGDMECVTLADKLSRPGVDELYFDIDGFLDTLGDDAYWLVNEALDPSDRMMLQVKLVVLRKCAISEYGHWKIKPTKLMYRRALGWTKERLEDAWAEVCETLVAW